MKTMLIGLFRLVTILVRSEPGRKAILSLTWCILLTPLTSCEVSPFSSGLLNESQSDYGCTHNCERFGFKAFSGQTVHLEIEPVGQLTQVFYYVDPKILKTTPIVLRDIIEVKGFAPGAEALNFEKDAAPTGNQSDFTDIIALPMINNTDFLTPRIQTRKAYLTSGGYQLELLSNLLYTLILNPSGFGNHPPIHFSSGLLASDQTMHFIIEENAVIGRGRVISDSPHLFAHANQPLLRARLMQGPRLVSSVAEVKDDGSFFLNVANPLFSDLSEQPINVVLEPINPESALPRIKHKIAYETIKHDFDLGTINLGDLESPFSVTIDVRGTDKSIVGKAYLYLSAKVGQGINLIKKQADASGTTTFHEMFEGRYHIAVVPPFDSPFAMQLIKDVKFDAHDQTKLSITLDWRKELNATVIGPKGQAMSGAQIEFLRVGEIGNLATEDIYDDMLFKLTAVTNEDGQVCDRRFGFSTSDKNHCDNLLLDEGRYLAHIIPPAGTEIAHKWIVFDFPEQSQLSIVLDQPEMLVGQIVGSDRQTPIKNAFVTVYLAKTNPHNQATLIGNAITDDRGFFRAFVSSR